MAFLINVSHLLHRSEMNKKQDIINIALNFTYSIEVTLQYYISCYDTIHRRYKSAGEMG